jgi:hypothetical protein
MLWGKDDEVRARFAAAGVPEANITTSREFYTFRFPGSPGQFIDMSRNYYGPNMVAFEAAEKDGRADALYDELVALYARQNISSDPQQTEIPAAFLKVVVAVP